MAGSGPWTRCSTGPRMSKQNVRTASVMVQTLCVPCYNRCRYCLLRWDGRCVGADYECSQAYAGRFYDWIRNERPELRFHFAFGYSMDHPRLPEALGFMRRIGSVFAEMMQMDGVGFRDEPELTAWLGEIRQAGVKHLNFTFYGPEAYHDRFAARQGDFAYMVRMIDCALKIGFEISAGIPLTHENAENAAALVSLLREHGVENIRCFIPHAEGRGISLEAVRFSQRDYEGLPEEVRGLINARVYMSEAAWLKNGFAPMEKRLLLLSLTPENIGRLEKQDFAETMAEMEALDEAYYNALPSMEELAALYGDPQSDQWYSQRDLLHHYQRRYIAEKGLALYDVTDERQTGSRRY